MFAVMFSSCWSSSSEDNQFKIVSMLLDARCDPNIHNSFQKTPLEEFIINVHAHSSHAALKLLFSATAGAREKVQAFLRDDGDTSSVKAGDKVLVKCRNGLETNDFDLLNRSSDVDGVDMIKGKWYRGVITRDHRDGSYDVAYDNFLTEERVPHHCISLFLW